MRRARCFQVPLLPVYRTAVPLLFSSIVAVSGGNFGADWSWEVRTQIESFPSNFCQLLLLICSNSGFVRFFMGG